jgi:predicted NBD/HSP70 family sugar kinase
MQPLTDPVIGVDVGATTISCGLVRPGDGTVLAAVQAPTVGSAVVDSITSLIERVLDVAAGQGLPVAGIGIGLPGLVDVEKGYMRSLPGAWLRELADVPLTSSLRERTGRPVFVDNDVNALALAEWMYGAGRGATSLVTVAIGTGIGSGLIMDGAVVRGHFAAAGEIGHLSVNRTGPRCVCGGTACLGTYVAGGFLADRVRERLGRYADSAVLARAGGDPARIGGEDVFRAGAAGDPLGRELVDEACEALAMGIGALVSLLNPELIVITGGVAASLVPLREDIMRRVQNRALPSVLDATTVRIVPTDKRATVRGGAALVRYEMARRGQEA